MSDNADLIDITAEIVSAYLGNNRLDSAEIPALIESIFRALEGVKNGTDVPSIVSVSPAVPIESSVTSDYIVCLEDGKRFKSLKRHLRTHYNLSPEEYRKKWDLPSDYPMVAPNYARARSKLAKKMGLGKKSTARPRRA